MLVCQSDFIINYNRIIYRGAAPQFKTPKRGHHIRRAVEKLAILLNDDVPIYWNCGLSIGKAVISYIKEPAWMYKVATIVFKYWNKMLAATVNVDVIGDNTIISIDVLPFNPLRN